MLKRGLVLIGGAVGLGAVGAVAAAERPGSTADTMTLLGSNFRMATTDGGAWPRPQRGDRLLTTGDLVGEGGDPVGEFHAAYFGVASSGQVGIDAPTGLEWHTFSLGEGTIIGMGVSSRRLDAPDIFAIVGGTGRFADAHGTYRAVQRHVELGGDGTAEFLMQFHAGRV